MHSLIFLLLVSSAALAQTSDTLLPRILLVKNDTERVNQLYSRGFAIRNSDPQAAFQYASLCGQHARGSRSEKHLAKSYNLLGILYYKKGNYKTALGYHQQALQLRQHCGDNNGMAASHLNLGNVYSDLKLFEQAEYNYLQAMSAYKLSGNSEKTADCLLNIGTLKHQQKQYDAAIENYKLAQELSGLNDYNTKAIFLTNIAQAFIAKGDIEKGIACNEDALKLRIMSDNNLETGDNYLNLAGAYIIKNDLLKAKYFLDTARYIAGHYNYFELGYEVCGVSAAYYEQNKQFEEALYWHKKRSALKDSLFMQQAIARQLFDFNELPASENTYTAAGLNNRWLMAGIFSLLIFIPLFLSRFKR